jgi:hypothetical protein
LKHNTFCYIPSTDNIESKNNNGWFMTATISDKLTSRKYQGFEAVFYACTDKYGKVMHYMNLHE